MAKKRIFQLATEADINDIDDNTWIWMDEETEEGVTQIPSWKVKGNLFLKILNNFATKFVPNVATVEGKCYWHDGELYECNTAYTGNWNSANFTATTIDALFERKDVVAALQTEISNLSTYAQNVAHSVAKEFDPTVDYLPGEKCINDGKLVKFVTKHSAGAIVAGETKRVDLTDFSDGLSEEGYFIDVGSLEPGNTVSFVPTRQGSTPYNLCYGVFSTEGVNYIKFTDAFGGDSPRLWCFVDDDNKVIAVEPQQSLVNVSKLVIVPNAAKYVIISIRNGSFEFIKDKEVSYSRAFVNVNLDGKMSLESTANLNYTVLVQKVSAGDSFSITATAGGNDARVWAFVDEDFNVIESASGVTSISNKFIMAPTGAVYLVVSSTSAIIGNVIKLSVFAGEDYLRLDTKSNRSRYSWANKSGNSVNPNVMEVSTKDVVHAAAKTEGYTHALCIGIGGIDARTWSFSNSSGVSIASASVSAHCGYKVIAIPEGADIILFQALEFGFCYLLKSDKIPDKVYSELLSAQNAIPASVMANVDSSGYLKNISFPPNIVNGSECCILRLDAEFSTGTPTITFDVDNVSVAFKLTNVNERKKYSFRIPPSLINGGFRITLSVNNTNFKLYGIVLSYGGVQTANLSGIRFDAHLGLCAYAPENSMIAFSLAAQCGYHGCICNPIKSADGTYYCYHEDTASLTLDGTTAVSLSGSQFHAKTDAELQAYKVFGTNTSQRANYLERIPTLKEFLELCAFTGMRPVFSTHPALSASEFAEVKAMCDKLGLTEKLTIKAFDLNVLETAYSVFGKIDRYVADYTTVSDIDAIIEDITSSSFCVEGQNVGVEIRYSQLSSTIGEKVIAAGLSLGTWDILGSSFADKVQNSLDYGVSFFTEDGYNPNAGMIWK